MQRLGAFSQPAIIVGLVLRGGIPGLASVTAIRVHGFAFPRFIVRPMPS
jgi:hypothetical protein